MLSSSPKTSAQIISTNPYPKGIYKSINEMINKVPSDTNVSAVKIITRTSEVKFMMGGNDYKLSSSDNSISNKILKKEVYAFSSGDSLYINGTQFNISQGYCKVVHFSGNYLVFYGGPTRQQAGSAAFLGGMIGSAIVNSKKYVYVLSLKAGKIKPLNENTMQLILKDNNELLQKFNNDTKDSKNNIETLCNYLNLLTQ